MNNEKIQQKLDILADAAKYDVSCASSGSNRRNATNGIGSGVACGICHSFTEDGRCISLFKILMTNHCIYDCAYCVNRRSNDRPRATFTPQEIVDLTIGFYRFKGEEILSEDQPYLDLDVDPKLEYALRNLHLFPIDVNTADYKMILRIPGVGVQSAQRIVQARRHRKLTFYHLKKIGMVLKRAK